MWTFLKILNNRFFDFKINQSEYRVMLAEQNNLGCLKPNEILFGGVKGIFWWGK